jgi:hypothetical protein
MAIPPPHKPWTTRLWRWLMTPVGKRVPVGENGAPHGIALFTVLIGLAMMSAVVTDLGANEMVRYKLAAHDRDAMKAQALAESGVNTARLLLAIQAAVQPFLSQLAQAGIPLPAHTIWQLVPLESDILKGMTSGALQSALGMDVTDALSDRAEKMEDLKEDAEFGFDSEAEGAGDGPFVPPEGGYGAFDGNFSVEIEDEERKAVSLRGWSTATGAARFATAQRLFTLFQPKRYDFLFDERDAWGNRTDRNELIAHIYDWIDTNEDATDPGAEPTMWGRPGGSAEDSYYTSYDELEPKNDYFDSHLELRRVRGITDAHMKAFGDSISIYGENKINILSAPPQSIEALIRICAANPLDPLLLDQTWMQQTVATWGECKRMGMMVGGCQVSPEGFASYLQTGMGTQGIGLIVNQEQCLQSISTESKNFVVKSTATVGDVSRTIRLVLRVHGAIEERYHYTVQR